jgi:hypothetical protein
VRLLAEHDRAALAAPGSPLAAATLFQREDTLVRMVDLSVPCQDAPEAAAGTTPGPAAQELARLLDLDADTDLGSRAGIERLLAHCSMDPVTDRRAQDA